jgi:hypothetical protein
MDVLRRGLDRFKGSGGAVWHFWLDDGCCCAVDDPHDDMGQEDPNCDRKMDPRAFRPLSSSNLATTGMLFPSLLLRSLAWRFVSRS